MNRIDDSLRNAETFRFKGQSIDQADEGLFPVKTVVGAADGEASGHCVTQETPVTAESLRQIINKEIEPFTFGFIQPDHRGEVPEVTSS